MASLRGKRSSLFTGTPGEDATPAEEEGLGLSASPGPDSEDDDPNEDELYDEPDPEEEPPADTRMSNEDLQSYLRGEIEEAESVAQHQSAVRQHLTERYDGEPYGDEEEGQSQVVTRDVRDTIHAILPSLVRIFCGSDRVLQFSPRSAGDVELAEQQTDYVNLVLTEDNPGFLTLYSAFKDALIRRQGVIKWWWDDSREPITDTYTGIHLEAAQLLAEDARAIGASIRFKDSERGEPGTIDMEVKRLESKAHARVMAVPPEELLISGNARCIDSARLVAHRRYCTVSELVAMGYELEDVLEKSGSDDFHVLELEARKRLPMTTMVPGADNPDPANRMVLYVEAYPRVDVDGDGIAELRKVCLMGESLEVMHNEPAIERPFALLCPDPTPHTVFGKSIADLVDDIQQISTGILRRMLNSLANAITPRIAVVEGQVNIEDVLNNENSSVIRQRAPGMVQPLNVPFVGQEAFPMISLMQELRENRTGISKAAAGLDADALQSSTRAAVAATVSAASQHIELIARIFAETGLKRLYKGLYGLLKRHQDAERVERLRGKFIAVSPASWTADADVRVAIAPGQSPIDERVMKLEKIAMRQEGILQQYGPQNPLVSVAQYRNTLAAILELSGFPDVSRFFSEVPPDWQPPQKPEQQTPEMILAQVQVEQIRADIAMKDKELELKREEMILRDDRERDKAEAELLIKVRELELQYQTAIDTTQINAMMSRQRELATEQPAAQGTQPNA